MRACTFDLLPMRTRAELSHCLFPAHPDLVLFCPFQNACAKLPHNAAAVLMMLINNRR